MKKIITTALWLASIMLPCVAQSAPAGEVKAYQFSNSKIYPGTVRDYWVYTPATYVKGQPAALMVFQDGAGYMNPKGPNKATLVFDELIHKKEMPVTIGVFINPGVVPAANANAQPRFNRSYEYDAFSADYANFLINEILPEVEKNYTITHDPNLRGICGASSGGIAAFTAAWHRPDSFRRVYSMIGTFVGLRGGDEISTLIRKTEPKPLRIFLQDGSNDNNIYCGDWWIANQAMERSLVFSGYDVNHKWDDGKHSHEKGGAIFSEVMRWLWQNYDKPITTHLNECKGRANELLVEGENWQLVSEGHGFTEGPVCAKNGDVFFTDIPNNKIHRIAADGKVSVFMENTRATNGLALGPDDRLYGCRAGSKEIVSWDISNKSEKIHATGINGNDLVVANDGTIYVTEPPTKSVWVIQPGKEKILGSNQFHGVNGITLTPDQTRVEVADPSGRYVWSALRNASGGLDAVQPYHHLHIPSAAPGTNSAADGMKVTRDGWLLVATAMGVQVCDQPGRVNLIIPSPIGARHPSNLCLGGENLSTLYITAGDKVFKRKTKFIGTHAWEKPVNPPKPGL